MGFLGGLRSFFAGNDKSAFGGRRDAARRDISELNGWEPPVSYAGSDTYGMADLITGRARDLDENNGWINGGIDRRIESVIGVQIRLSAQPVYGLLSRDYEWRMKWTADVQQRWKVWANDVERRSDARRRLSFGAIARLAYLSYVRDGEAAIEIRDEKRGLPNTTCLLLVEPERISTPSGMTESVALRNGVAFDRSGAVAGYWVRSGHPADPVPDDRRFRWDYVPARGKTGRAKFVHIMSPRRVEQNRGISRLAEAMVPAKMLDRVDRAEVVAALKSAIFSFFIKSPGTADDVAAMLAPTGAESQADPWIADYLKVRKNSPVRIEGAQVNHLFPGEDVVTPTRASPNENYPPFARFVLQKVAASLGVSYPQISQDYAGINYSSARVLLNEVWRSFLEDRQYFTQHMLTPIYAAWLEMEVANGDVKVPGGPTNFYRNKTALAMAEWIGPGRGSVDPLKESNADNLDTAAGRKSTVESILDRGREPIDVMSEESWFLEERRKRGLAEPNHNVKAESGSEDSDGGTVKDGGGDGIVGETGNKKKDVPA